MEKYKGIIVINKRTKVLYEYLGGSDVVELRNLHTGEEGEIPKETFKKAFSLPIRANILVQKFPILKKMITNLNLTIINYEYN